MAGSGTPLDPWVVTTVNDVPGTKLRLTQRVSYVNGAEFVKMLLSVQQVQGTQPEKVSLFHAADLESMGGSTCGYFNHMCGAVGGYYFTPSDVKVYQLFVPHEVTLPADVSHQEGRFEEIWDAIGDAAAPGPGFNNICQIDQPLDAGIGLQWNLTVPIDGAVTVGDTMFFSPHTNLAGSFSDVRYGTFYYDPAYYLATNNIASGYSDTTFRPMNNTTRGQLTKLVVLAEGWKLYTPPKPTFSDVPADHPFYVYIETAVQHRAINGYDDLTFHPFADITRGQLAKVITLAEGLSPYFPPTPTFSDVPADNNFYPYIEAVYLQGIITGYNDGTFRPFNPATRGQISKIVYLAVTPP
jgi:hypothetical protein